MIINLRNKRTLISIATLIVAIILGILYFRGIPALVNIEKHRPEIEKAIKEQMQVPIYFGKLNTSVSWDLGIILHVSNIDIKHKDGSPFISTGPASIKLFMPSFLRHNITIKEVRATIIAVRLKRFSNGKFDIGELYPKKTKKPSKYKVRFSRTNILASLYQVYYKDSYVRPNKNYTVVGDYIKINDFTPGKFIKISGAGQVVTVKKPNTYFDVAWASMLPIKRKSIVENNFSLNGKILNLLPEMYFPYIDKYIPFVSEIKGLANLEFNFDFFKSGFRKDRFDVKGTLDKFHVVGKKGMIIDVPDKAEIAVKGYTNNDLYFDNVSIKNDKINTGLRGSVLNYKSKDRQLDLVLKMTKTRAYDLAAIFPKNIHIPFDAFRKIVKYHIDGNVWTNLLIKGPAKKPDLYGDIKFNDVIVGQHYKDIPYSYGQINFNGKNIFLNIDAFPDPKGKVKVKGRITPLISRTIDLNINTNSVDLNKSRRLLLIVRNIFRFKLGPVRYIHAITGRGKVNLTIRGKLKHPQIFGYVKIYNATGYYQYLYGIFNNINGTLKFLGDRIDYNGINGFMEGSKAVAEGYTTIPGGYSDVKLSFPHANLITAEKVVNRSYILRKLKTTLKNIKNVSGIADIVVYLIGDQHNLISKGNLIFYNAKTNYVGYGEPFRDVVGKISYDENNVYFKDLTGTVIDSRVTMNGTATKNSVNLLLTSPQVNLSKILKFVRTSSALTKTQQSLSYFTSFSGYASGKLKVSGNIKQKNILDYMVVKTKKAVFTSVEYKKPITIINSEILLTKDGMFTKGLYARVDEIPIKAVGKITGLASGKFISDFKLQIAKFDFSKIKEIAASARISPRIKEIINDFNDLKGKLSANVSIYPGGFRTDIKPYGLSAKYTLYNNIPITINSGYMTITQSGLAFNNLDAQISKSPVHLNGSLVNYTTHPNFNLVASAKVNAEDIQDYINPCLSKPLNAQGEIPVAMNLQGKWTSWKALAQMTLEKGDVLSYQSEFALPSDKIRVLSLRMTGVKNNVDIQNLEVSMADNPIEAGLSASPQPGVETSLNRLLVAHGGINNLFTNNLSFNNLQIYTPDSFDITLLNPAIKTETGQPLFSQGEFKGNILLQGPASKPQLTGNLSLNDTVIPSKNMVIDYADADFNQDQLVLKDSYIKIKDSPIKIQAVASNLLERPIIINSLDIYSPSLNIDEIVDTFRQPGNEGKKEENNEPPPFIVETGKLRADELIISNLITQNLTSDFDFSRDWLLTLSNLNFGAANGTAQGKVLYNVKTTELNVNLTLKDMQANAAATTLLNLPNEVYGTLNGDVKFDTRGSNSREMIANANGVTDFKITNGRLVRLGSIEYLLRAANVLQSGIAGLNINNILDLIAPHETGYFQVLEGKVTAKEGIAHTEGITSKGKNLSLFLKGDLDLVTNNAQITILGRLSRKVSGLLGPLGSISINTFIGFIPGIGFLPSSPETSLIDIIGLNRIPALGLGNGKYRLFEVKINGNLYDPGSVKSFRWIDEKSLKKNVFETK